jgi:hypothetical protein
MIEAEKAKMAPKIGGKAAKKAGEFQNIMSKFLNGTAFFCCLSQRYQSLSPLDSLAILHLRPTALYCLLQAKLNICVICFPCKLQLAKL